VLKKQIILISASYTFVLTYLSLIKVNDKLPSIENSDKLYHIIAYFIFFILWFYTFHLKFKYHQNKALILAFSASVFFGILIEILQGLVTRNRQSDLNDVIANVVGAFLASLMMYLLKKRGIKYK